MKDYDMKMHIPQQIENYLQAYASADISTLTRSLENIKDLTNDPEMQKDLYKYDKEKHKLVTQKMDETCKQIQKAIENKTSEEALIYTGSILEALNTELDVLEQKYWEHVHGYILQWINGHE